MSSSSNETPKVLARFHPSWAVALLLVLLPVTAAAETATQEDPGDIGRSPAEMQVREGEDRTAEETTVPEVEQVLFDRLMVIGGPEKLWEVPGSAHYIGKQELERQNYFDLHRILRQVPGLNIQEEEGYGLRPNVGMRGTGVERSSKITLLEDGVLIAPAPYAAPAAYYTPTAGRMAGFEILKGPASIRQGPYTTGGVINMLSSDYPVELGGRLRAAYGEHATGRLHAGVGDTGERLSWLVETYQLDTEGFKDLDGGGETGVSLEDYLGKVRFTSRPGAAMYQAVELKLGKTEQLGDETYLGLTRDDYAADPYRRYAASQEDTIDTDHEQYQLRHFLQPTEWMDVTTTLYRNDFFRNWHKLGSVGGVGIATLLDSPEDHAEGMAIVRGEQDSAPGALSVRNNRRDYYSQGAEMVLGFRLGGDRVAHDLAVGIRYHEDEEDRFQEDDRFQMADGRMVLTSLGAPGSNSNRVSSAEALAVFVQDEIRAGRWVVRPGARFETIDFRREDFGRNDPDRTGENLGLRESSVDVLVPGIGVDYLLADDATVFFGVHKGFSPPGPGADENTEAEESVSYEVGYRHRGSLTWEVVGFFNDFDNLLGADTLSGGGPGSGDLFNGGAVEVYGLEASLSRDLAPTLGARGASIPVRLVYSYTKGEFQTSFSSGFADWSPGVTAGDEIPYLPEHQVYGSLGFVRDRWSAHLDASWVDEMRTSPGRGTIPADEGTDLFLTFDLALEYELLSGLRIDLQVRNVTDEEYVAARRPAGLRPGMPRTTLAGLSWTF